MLLVAADGQKHINMSAANNLTADLSFNSAPAPVDGFFIFLMWGLPAALTTVLLSLALSRIGWNIDRAESLLAESNVSDKFYARFVPLAMLLLRIMTVVPLGFLAMLGIDLHRQPEYSTLGICLLIVGPSLLLLTWALLRARHMRWGGGLNVKVATVIGLFGLLTAQVRASLFESESDGCLRCGAESLRFESRWAASLRAAALDDLLLLLMRFPWPLRRPRPHRWQPQPRAHEPPDALPPLSRGECGPLRFFKASRHRHDELWRGPTACNHSGEMARRRWSSLRSHHGCLRRSWLCLAENLAEGATAGRRPARVIIRRRSG